jgi:uncharacterized membrane protein YdjX (TVP38/TMEM64 family)
MTFLIAVGLASMIGAIIGSLIAFVIARWWCDDDD